MKKFKKANAAIFVLILMFFSVQIKTYAFTNEISNNVTSKIAVIHFNPKLGDTNYNVSTLKSLIQEAFENGANIIVTPELSTTGYCINRSQVTNGLGFSYPYPQLDDIKNLAIKYKGYVVIGMAEVSKDSKVYNSAAVFGPNGFIKTQDKRNMPLWNDKGVLPFETIQTPYGDLGVMICADSYLPDWGRILTLQGADIIAVPANWWGDYGQKDIWSMQAKENGVWLAVANRWGYEEDKENNFVCDMKDAPSAIINPTGKILQTYKAEDSTNPKDKILYQTISVPKNRIGSKFNNTYTVAERQPTAYGEIANNYYRSDLGYKIPSDLPAAGNISAASLSYIPSLNCRENLNTIESLWKKQNNKASIVVLPGLGFSRSVNTAGKKDWFNNKDWTDLQNFVKSNSISLLVTTINEFTAKGCHESLVLIQPDKKPELVQQIHNYNLSKGSGNPPVVLDLLNARVGILTGHDALFSETATELAKSGVDIMIVSSTAGINSNIPEAENLSTCWNIDSLKQLWKCDANEGLHIIASDWTGNAMIIKNGGYYIDQLKETNNPNEMLTCTLDTSTVRYKYLNSYYPFDLNILLNTCSSSNKVSVKETIKVKAA